jgi:hypothetical protein
MEALSRPGLTSKPQFTSWRGRAARVLSSAAALALTLPVTGLAQSQDAPQASGNPNFIPAPLVLGEGDGSLSSIFGVDVNVIFFVAVAVVAVLWFTIGGGRKAKMKRS